MTDRDDELQTRVCRACSQTYRYPVLKSLATRFHCEACMRLDPEVRAVFEAFNRRIKSLAAEVDKLKKVADSGRGKDMCSGAQTPSEA
jgi:hypothetical protein